MPLAFLLDEHLRGPLWQAILRHNLSSSEPIDSVRIGDPPAPPLSEADRAILLWAQQHGRILVTADAHTIPRHLKEHIAAGGRSPGILMARSEISVKKLVESLWLIAYAGQPEEFADAVTYIP